MGKYASEVVNQMKTWIGKKESNGTHKEIIDIYNSQKKLPNNYRVKYTDAWCATTVSAVAVKLGYTDIIPTECSCERMIEEFKKIGIWVENENRTPNPGDIIFYDWQDDGKGDNKGWSDHVGIVEKVSGTTITVIEGNYSDSVKRRTIKVNAKNIRGYGVPKYDKEVVVSKPTATTVDNAKCFDKKLARTYTTTSDLNMRCGSGTNKDIVTVLKNGSKVTCYGYYTPINGTKWLLVTANGHTGFVSSKYVK